MQTGCPSSLHVSRLQRFTYCTVSIPSSWLSCWHRITAPCGWAWASTRTLRLVTYVISRHVTGVLIQYQTLCVNDVVQKAGSVRATEGDLRAAQLTSKTDAATTQTKRLTNEAPTTPPQGVLDGASGTVSRKLIDGQKEVSQVVSWEATFIENSSDILKKLDVSGMLCRQPPSTWPGIDI